MPKQLVLPSQLRDELRTFASAEYPQEACGLLIGTLADGLEIVGVWHSHPNSPAVPSTIDLENAWAEISYLILSISSDGETDTRSWRLDGKCFVEEIIRSDDL